MSESKELIISSGDQLLQPTTRRRFLSMMGVAGSVVLLPSVFAACDDNPISPDQDPDRYRLNLSDDTGILNYAFALEQLEAAFYTSALTSTGFAQLSAAEQEVLVDLQRHEVIHREFFKAALGTTNAIPSITFNSTTVGQLTANASILLSTSQLLEDTGVSAYNGAGKYLKSAANLLLAGKIVSVEARHAAAIRDMRDIRAGNSGRLFAGDDVVTVQNALDVKMEPAAVLASVASLNVLVSPLSLGTEPGPKTPEFRVPNPA